MLVDFPHGAFSLENGCHQNSNNYLLANIAFFLNRTSFNFGTNLKKELVKVPYRRVITEYW